MSETENVFESPCLQRQPATRQKLIYSGLWVMIGIACAAGFAYLADLEAVDRAPAALPALYLLAGGGVFLSIALIIIVFNKFTGLATEQFRAELEALPDGQLLLCGQLKNHVPEDEWQVVRSVLRERWQDWDVRLSELLDRRGL